SDALSNSERASAPFPPRHPGRLGRGALALRDQHAAAADCGASGCRLRLARGRAHAAERECPYSYHAIGHIPEGKSMHSTSKSVFPFANATEEYGCPKRERPTSQGVSAAMTMAAPAPWTRNSQPACAWDTIPERGVSAAD